MIYAASGNCHVYVDATADLDDAAADRRQRQDAAAGRLQRGRDAARARRRRGGVPARALARAARRAASSCAADERAGALLDAGASPATDEDFAEEFLALILAVKVVDSLRRGDRARQPLRLRALRGDRHRQRAGGAGVPARRRRGLRLRQRLDALHRRRRVRHGRRDRQLDPEAARARPDRPARALHVQVPGRRRRPGRGRSWRASASSAGRSTRRTSGTWCARRRR